MKTRIHIYDTTLRDGTQGEGVSLSVHDKLLIAERLDSFGVHYIEGGWPGSNPRDIEFFRRAKKMVWKNAQLVAFGSTCRKGVQAKDDPQIRLLLEAETPVVTIFGKTWRLHIEKVLKTTLKENLRMIENTVRYLVSQGRIVIYDAEHAFDGFKHNPKYAMATLLAAQRAGAQTIVLCDTNGGTPSPTVYKVVARVVKKLRVEVGIHTHNDAGLAVANTLVAVYAGATHVQGTINGIGERAGNCDLISMIAHLAFKLRRDSVPKSSLPQLTELSRFVDEVANLAHNSRQPWVGRSAFAHKGGMHVNALEKCTETFEHIDPALVGNKRRVLISDLAGRSNIILKARELGIEIDPDTSDSVKILGRIKRLENQGYEFEAAEGSLAILIKSIIQRHRRIPFIVSEYHVSMRGGRKVPSVCEATVKVSVEKEVAHTVANGDGPVNALDSALRLALVKFFPNLTTVKLIDYKVRILAGRKGSAAKTRVLIQSSNGKREWGTVGVDENIIEASLKALIDSFLYALTIID